MPGCGKTFLGKYAANKLGVDFVDLDEVISKEQSLSISEIFRIKGEEEFRNLELIALKNLIGEIKQDTIIATGGGTPCYNNAMEVMNDAGITVWLDVDIAQLIVNIQAENAIRPLFNDPNNGSLEDKLGKMYQLRRPFYDKSEVKVAVNRGLSPDLFTNHLHLSTFAKYH